MAITINRTHNVGPTPSVSIVPAEAAQFFDVEVRETGYTHNDNGSGTGQDLYQSISYNVYVTRKDVPGSARWHIVRSVGRNWKEHGRTGRYQGDDYVWDDVSYPEQTADRSLPDCSARRNRSGFNSLQPTEVSYYNSEFDQFWRFGWTESHAWKRYHTYPDDGGSSQERFVVDSGTSYYGSDVIVLKACQCDQLRFQLPNISARACRYSTDQYVVQCPCSPAASPTDVWWRSWDDPTNIFPTQGGWSDSGYYSVSGTTVTADSGDLSDFERQTVIVAPSTVESCLVFDHWEAYTGYYGDGQYQQQTSFIIPGRSFTPTGASEPRTFSDVRIMLSNLRSPTLTVTTRINADDDKAPCTETRGGTGSLWLRAVYRCDSAEPMTQTEGGTPDYPPVQTETTQSGTTIPPLPPVTEPGTRTRSAVKVTVTFDSSQGYANAGGAQTSVVRTGYVGDTRTVELNAYPESIPGQESCPTYKFSGWYENGVCLSTDEKYFLEHVLKDGYSEEAPEERTIEARFERAGPTVRLTATTSPAVNGWTVDPGVAEYTKSGSCANNSSATVMLVASSDGASEYRFVRWETSGTGITLSDANSPVTTATLAFPDSTIVREVTATAILEQRETACVAFNAHAAEGGTVSGGGTVCGKAGDRLCAPQALVATPNTGWRFVKWTNASGTTVSESASFSPCATATAGATKTFSYTAHFVRARITLVAAIGGVFGNGGWAVSPDTQTADAPTDGSTTVSFVLNAVDGQPYVHRRDDYDFGGVPQKYDFDEWETNDEGVTFEDATKPVTTVTVTVPNDGSDRTVNVAAFLKERPKVTVTVTTAPSPAAGGQTAGDGTVSAYRGDIVVWDIYAFPAEDGGFLWWTKDGVMQDLQAEDDIQLNAPDEEGGSVTYALVAHFLGETGTSDETEGHTTTPPEPPGPGSGTTGGQTSATSGTAGTGTAGTTGTAVETGVVVFKTILMGTGQGTTNPEERTVRAEVGETVTFESTAAAAAGSRFQEWLDASKARITTDATVEAEATVTSEPQVVKLYAVMAIVGPLIYGSGGKLLHNGVCDALVYADEVVVGG